MFDGEIHNNTEVQANDEIRQKNLQDSGINVVRFTNKEVFSDLEMVLNKIKSHLIIQKASLQGGLEGFL